MFARRYENARDYFNAVRRAYKENRYISENLARMRTREQVRAQSYTEGVSITGNRDTTQPTDTRISYEEASRAIYNANEQLLAQAQLLLYGKDAHGGAIHLLGVKTVACMYMYYLNAMSWDEIAKTEHFSKRQLLRNNAAALECLDYYGIANILKGEGCASE